MGGLLSLVTLLRAGVPSYLSRGSQIWPGVDTLICISDYCCDEYILQAPSVAWCLALSSRISLLLINQAKGKIQMLQLPPQFPVLQSEGGRLKD